MAFLALLVQCYSPLRSLGNLLPALYSATAGVERMVELLDEELPQDAPGARDLTHVRGAVELSGVRVRYPGAGRDALHGASFRIEPGELVALVGPSGAGKSTVARLLTRHVEVADGAVRIDGQDLRDLTARSVRDAVTLVPQETALMDATIAENIGFGRPGAGRARGRGGRPPGGRGRLRPAAAAGLRHPGRPARPQSSPAASASGSRSRGRCSATRRCCSSTSRPPAWTPTPRAGSSTRWPGTGPAARSSWPPTTRSRWSTSTA